MSPLICLTLAATLAAHPAPDRYTLSVSLTAAPASSADTRFELLSSARLRRDGLPAPAAAGRFALKSASGTLCTDSSPIVFRNGFE